MKETHLFYAPQLQQTQALPEEEAAHAVRVLRMTEGDSLWVTDGCGTFFDCTIAATNGGKHPACWLNIEAQRTWQTPWTGAIHLAVAPTKNMDRLEWMAEKATEIGFNALHLLQCTNSERRVVKAERLEKILVSAMKQSHKALLPQLMPMQTFRDFVQQPFEGDKFIAHCYCPSDIGQGSTKEFLFTLADSQRPTLVLVGPEGDFSIEEVRWAESLGFRSVHLGESRLRTETAGLLAAQLVHLKKTM